MIKNWLQFIKESQQLELFKDEGIFPYTEEDIMDYLLELEDNKYFIDIRFGWLDKEKDFTQKVEGHIVEPCISIDINSSGKTKNEDVTSGVTSFIKRMSKKAKSIKIYDNDGEIPLKFLRFEGGIFLNERPEDSNPNEAGNYDDIQLDDGIFILCVFNKRGLTDKDIFEYYRISGEKLSTNEGEIDCLSYTDKGTPVFEVDVEDLVRWTVDRNDSYSEYIIDSSSIWDNYRDYYDYLPDHYSFFNYHLSDENRQLLLKVCIEKDGWETIIEKLDEDITEEDFIGYSNYNILGELLKSLPLSSDIYSDLRRLYVNFEEDAKAEEDLKEIISKFDELVEEQFKTSIIEKNRYSKKKIRYKENDERYEYDYEFQTYKLLFNDEWIENMDAETIMNAGSTYNILSEYSGNNIYTEKLNPYFSDYASVDDVEFNKSAKSDLESHLKSTE